MDTNSQIYKLTFWSSARPILWPLFVTIVFIAGFIPILTVTANSDSFFFALIVATIWICITGIPPMVLELNYLFHDWEMTLKIDQPNGIMEISRRDVISRFQFQDFTRIEKHHSGLEKGDRLGRMHWFPYYYYKVYVRNHKPILVSRMIIAKLEKQLKNVKCELIWRRFPIIRS